jgi:hypothetical protein
MFKTCQRWAVQVLPFIVGAPAMADIQATYVRGDREQETITIEFAEDGALRISERRGDYPSYLLFVEGQSYSVEPGPGGPNVVTVEAAAELARRSREGAIFFGETSTGTDEEVSIQYVSVGSAKIAGYDGVRYNFPGAFNPEVTQIVLSENPDIRSLGAAFLTYSQAIHRISGREDDVSSNLYQLISEHGVLSIWGYELKSISFEEIDRSRFAIPAAPLALAELPQSEPRVDQPTENELLAAQPFVVSAAFYEEILYTLSSDGRMQAWSEGVESGMDVEVPAFVLGFCALEDAVFLVTGKPYEGTARVWAGRPGAWSLVTEFTQSDSDPFLAVDCSGPQPVVLSGSAIRLPNESRSIAIGSGAAGPFGASTTLQHDGYLYVGSNAGEFGGGLIRFPMSGGAGQLIDAPDAQELCGGVLNSDCGPVTGLAADPFRPDCILAATGLVHFVPHGSVVRICGESISLAYAKPYTLDPNWKFDPEDGIGTHPSVAFYSLAGDGAEAWAVANDGIYRFGNGLEPEFSPFPRSFVFPKSGVDWSSPDFVLVLTTMNQRFSVSGGSLILVQR